MTRRLISLSETFSAMREDYRAVAVFHKRDPRSLGTLATEVLLPGFWAVVIHRLTYYFEVRRLKLVSRLLYLLNTLVTHADIGPRTEIGPGLILLHPTGTIISGKFGRNVILTAFIGVGGSGSVEDIGAGPGLPIIGDGVLLGAKSLVMGPIVIGDGAFVCAMTLVTRDVPAGGTVAGIPAVAISASARKGYKYAEPREAARVP